MDFFRQMLISLDSHNFTDIHNAADNLNFADGVEFVDGLRFSVLDLAI